MSDDIEEVREAIKKVEEAILDVERKLKESVTGANLAHLQEEKKQLRIKESQLRDKEMLWLRAELSGREQAHEEKMLLLRAGMSDSSKLLAAGEQFQLFVQSARRNYLEWERSGKEFLEVKGDPFANFNGAFLIWIRKCYVHLKNMLVEEKAKKVGPRFILLGTAGIGKSFFTIFWICYLATKKKRVVWRLASGSYFLLDFSQEDVIAHGPVNTQNPILLQVLYDADSWLIIDAGQETGLEFPCSILLACSAKKKNHHEFGKSQRVKTWYLPVWTEDEIKRFCDAFVEHESKFSVMEVPGKDTALANFKKLGGVPRYVLSTGKMDQGRIALQEALAGVSGDNCIQVYCGMFDPNLSDMLIHMFVDEEKGEYTRFEYDFACSEVRDLIEQHFFRIGKLQVVSCLEQTINSTMFGSLWGQVFENVAHVILSRGGNFRWKRVSETGFEVLDTLQQKELKLVKFKTLQELTKLKDDFPNGAYCKPSSLNFESVDGVIVPDTLVQYFKYSKGNHCYKIHGLKELDDALNLKNYSLWSCVPQESYDGTKYQNWVTTKGIKYKDMTSEVQGLVQKMQQYVVEVDYRKYKDCEMLPS